MQNEVTRFSISNDDIFDWSGSYNGDRFHALLCDPPYHFVSIQKRFGSKGGAPAQYGRDGAFSRLSHGFMQKNWDGGDISFRPETWQALTEHLHDGAFCLAFSSAREYPRLATALSGQVGVGLNEINFMADALRTARKNDDWGLVDQVEAWLRSFNRMKEAIEISGLILHPTIFAWVYGSGFPKATRIKGRDDWEGHRYGMQAMKPAIEPIIMFQKPYQGKPVENITSSGAGALNIDAGRIPIDPNIDDPRLGGVGVWKTDKAAKRVYNGGYAGKDVSSHAGGRYPSNFIVDSRAAELLDKQTGILKSGDSGKHGEKRDDAVIYNKDNRVPGTPVVCFGDEGGGSRFFFNIQNQLDDSDPVFYCAKASRSERDAGLKKYGNVHPCVKPIDLTLYLAGLLLPPNDYAPRRLLVPFSGSGSEMIGGLLAGWEEVVGIDAEMEYCELARKRITYWLQKHPPSLF